MKLLGHPPGSILTIADGDPLGVDVKGVLQDSVVTASTTRDSKEARNLARLTP